MRLAFKIANLFILIASACLVLWCMWAIDERDNRIEHYAKVACVKAAGVDACRYGGIRP